MAAFYLVSCGICATRDPLNSSLGQRMQCTVQLGVLKERRKTTGCWPMGRNLASCMGQHASHSPKVGRDISYAAKPSDRPSVGFQNVPSTPWLSSCSKNEHPFVWYLFTPQGSSHIRRKEQAHSSALMFAVRFAFYPLMRPSVLIDCRVPSGNPCLFSYLQMFFLGLWRAPTSCGVFFVPTFPLVEAAVTYNTTYAAQQRHIYVAIRERRGSRDRAQHLFPMDLLPFS